MVSVAVTLEKVRAIAGSSDTDENINLLHGILQHFGVQANGQEEKRLSCYHPRSNLQRKRMIDLWQQWDGERGIQNSGIDKLISLNFIFRSIEMHLAMMP